MDNDGNSLVWNTEQIIRNKRISNISQKDRKMYMRQVLHYDAHFFLSICLLRKESLRYELKEDEIVFDFYRDIIQYHTLTTFIEVIKIIMMYEIIGLNCYRQYQVRDLLIKL